MLFRSFPSSKIPLAIYNNGPNASCGAPPPCFQVAGFNSSVFFQAEGGIRDIGVTWSSDVCSSDLGFGFLQQSCDLVRPVWLLASEKADGNVQDGGGVVEGKPVVPRSRDVGEILLGELPRGRARPLSRYSRQSRHGGETREKLGGV